MSLYDVRRRAEALMTRAHELAQNLSRCRIELHGLALGVDRTPAAVSTDIRDLDDLLHIMNELQEAVEARVAHLAEEIGGWREEDAEEALAAAVPDRVQRFLAFAGQAGIALPPLN